jgi:alpha-D-ribose 1-methylphosphonate 5-triphosphate synthase subunit PhnH
MPTITSLSPASATAGGSSFTLTVNGTGFLSGATVQWNGTGLTTTFVSATQLTATVSAGLIVNVINASVTAVNNGGTPSAAATFAVKPPTPTLTSLSPTSATAGGSIFTLTVNGTGFLSGATVQWNGTGLATTFVNGSQLTATVPANLIASVSTASITAVNNGGNPSTAITVPAGYVSGLPVGITFTGARWSEPRLLALAYAFEQSSPVRHPPALAATATV